MRAAPPRPDDAAETATISRQERDNTPLRGDLVCQSFPPPQNRDSGGPEPRQERDRRGRGKADVGDVLAAARRLGSPSRGRGRARSPLHDWMRARAETLAAELDPPRRPDWARVAAVLGEGGVLDGAGNAPSPQTVRQTWWRVRRERLALSSRPGGEVGKREDPPAQTLPPTKVSAPTPPAPRARDDQAEPTPAPFCFSTGGARARGWTPGAGRQED